MYRPVQLLEQHTAYWKFFLATTSTLAVGVNLPAHLVIIKSTQGKFIQ